MPKVIGFLYRNILKPSLFLFDAEKVHDYFVRIGETLGCLKITRALTAAFFSYSNKKLEQDILGIKFSNPVGLAAGFDKDARMIEIMPAVGFGFTEIGSVTGAPCAGNPKPRLWRLPRYGALIVNYGLKNIGAAAVAARLAGKKFDIPVGISVAKTNSAACAETEAGVGDYAKALEALSGVGDYFTINISCPNAYGGQPFSDAQRLEKLLSRLDGVGHGKPVFLKLAPDLSETEIDAIIGVAGRHRVHGFVCSNLTKDRSKTGIEGKIFPGPGGISGPLARKLSDEQISHIYKKTGGKYVIIGVGGIFSAEDAFLKIRLGASLVELMTGMIFQGPQLIGEINRGLVRLMDKNGFKNISEAVGALNKPNV